MPHLRLKTIKKSRRLKKQKSRKRYWNKKTLKRRLKMKGGSSPYKVVFYTGRYADDRSSEIINQFSEEEFLRIEPYILEAVQSEIAGVIKESVRIIHREDGDIYVSLNFADESEREYNMSAMNDTRGYSIGPIEIIDDTPKNIQSYRIIAASTVSLPD